MKYLIKESQYVNLLENLDKNKKFLTNVMGVDFTGKLIQITSGYDVPYSFYRNGGITLKRVMSDLNAFGPMYLFELDGIEYLYLDRGNKDWFIDENGVTYIHDEITKVLGINVMGLRFYDIINMYFNEGDSVITESRHNMLKFQRRLGFVKEYIDGLPEDPDIDDICNHWTEDESDAFVSNTMWDLVTQICDEIGNMDSYDEIYEYLVDNGYRTQIEDFFFDTLRNYCSK